MNIRRLEIFCRVVELRSFTKAAEALLLSQPTVSEHIRALEEVLGDKMIDRLGREVLPTPAGKVFYRYAHDIVQMRDEAIEALARFKGQLAGQLVLGASTIPGTYILPELIASFKTVHPAIQITVRIADTADITRDVAVGDAEAGLIGSVPSDRRLKEREVSSDELILAVHPDHRWAGRGKVTPDELEGEPFVLREHGSGTRTVTEKILEHKSYPYQWHINHWPRMNSSIIRILKTCQVRLKKQYAGKKKSSPFWFCRFSSSRGFMDLWGLMNARFHREWMEEDVYILSTAARIITKAIESYQDQAEITKHRNRLEAIFRSVEGRYCYRGFGNEHTGRQHGCRIDLQYHSL